MTSSDIAELYFQWLYDRASDDSRVHKTYRDLLLFLHTVPFNYILPMDGNRESDGINLRYRFAAENNIDDILIRVTIDSYPCSVLEMMLALAIRCEESFMHDADIGDRTREWFWVMLTNLGLSSMSDGSFDRDLREKRVDTFIYRKYDFEGHGGLFTVPNCKRDMRSIEIWAQLMMYLNSIIKF